MSDLPEVTCASCNRTVKCIRVSDGTVYRPIAWTYPDDAKPLEGICGGCQEDDLDDDEILDILGQHADTVLVMTKRT